MFWSTASHLWIEENNLTTMKYTNMASSCYGARFSSHSKAYGRNDGRFSCSIWAKDQIQIWPWNKLHFIVCPRIARFLINRSGETPCLLHSCYMKSFKWILTMAPLVKPICPDDVLWLRGGILEETVSQQKENDTYLHQYFVPTLVF